MTTAAPLVIVDGNCQAHHISAIIAQCGSIEAYSVGVDYGFLPSFRNRPVLFLTEDEAVAKVRVAKDQGRVTYQASQATQLVGIKNLSYTSLVDRIISFPFLQFFTLSPQSFEGRFGFAANPKRIFNLDIGTVRVSQEKARSSFDFASYIAEHSPKRSLFQMTQHLGGELTGLLFREVASQIQGGTTAEIRLIFEELSMSDGMNFGTDHPMSAELLDELGFEWSPSYANYRTLISDMRAGEWMKLHDRRSAYLSEFSFDSQAWHALALSAYHCGLYDEADNCYERLLSLSPGHLRYWFDWLDVHLRQGSAQGLQHVIDQADMFFQGQSLFSYLMAFTEMRRNDLSSAEHYARDYAQRMTNRAGGIVPLLKILSVSGRVTAAQELTADFCRSASAQKISELKQNLVLLPELSLSSDDLDAFARSAQ